MLLPSEPYMFTPDHPVPIWYEKTSMRLIGLGVGPKIKTMTKTTTSEWRERSEAASARLSGEGAGFSRNNPL